MINQFYEENTKTCAGPVWAWRPRCCNFGAARRSVTLAGRWLRCDPETRTRKFDADGPPPRWIVAGRPFYSIVVALRPRTCCPAFCNCRILMSAILLRDRKLAWTTKWLCQWFKSRLYALRARGLFSERIWQTSLCVFISYWTSELIHSKA